MAISENLETKTKYLFTYLESLDITVEFSTCFAIFSFHVPISMSNIIIKMPLIFMSYITSVLTTYSVNGFFIQPSASSLRDIVIAPFSFGLWLSLLITYLIIVGSVFYFGRVYRKVYARLYEDFPENDSVFQNELVLWAVGAVTQQGNNDSCR